MSEQEIKHHAHLMTSGRVGSWCFCPCGWSSGTYGTVVAAHLAFGRHLLDDEPAPCSHRHMEDQL